MENLQVHFLTAVIPKPGISPVRDLACVVAGASSAVPLPLHARSFTA